VQCARPPGTRARQNPHPGRSLFIAASPTMTSVAYNWCRAEHRNDGRAGRRRRAAAPIIRSWFRYEPDPLKALEEAELSRRYTGKLPARKRDPAPSTCTSAPARLRYEPARRLDAGAAFFRRSACRRHGRRRRRLLLPTTRAQGTRKSASCAVKTGAYPGKGNEYVGRISETTRQYGPG
jgi:hypothetical protein